MCTRKMIDLFQHPFVVSCIHLILPRRVTNGECRLFKLKLITQLHSRVTQRAQSAFAIILLEPRPAQALGFQEGFCRQDGRKKQTNHCFDYSDKDAGINCACKKTYFLHLVVCKLFRVFEQGMLNGSCSTVDLIVVVE